MIKIIRKEDCTGCCACFDICEYGAISMVTDIEGFWYPNVNLDLCIDCGQCEKTCPELHVNDLKTGQLELPIVLAAYHKDIEVRRESTSGGIFSALANMMYEKDGNIAGSVYLDDFSSRHILSNIREDLSRIRGSKHSQSDMKGIYKQIKELLVEDKNVLICAAPCQIAGLRLFLDKDYNNLITTDFICLGINSPKIFKKYLESLERKYGAKTISVQAKNKDLGWRSLAYKINFANNKIYLQEGKKDNFTRGFIIAHCNCRPTCYECKYKGFPRISDITLGDFWGIESIVKTMDDNMGTSAVLLNTQKGIDFFNSIKDMIETKEMTLSDILSRNQALIHSITLPTINRDEFYKDADELPFDIVVKKYFPLKRKSIETLNKGLRFLRYKVNQMGYHPKPYFQFLWINFLRKNTQSSARRVNLIFPSRFTILDIHKTAHVIIKGSMSIGTKRIRGSKLETRLAVEGKGSLSIESGQVSVCYGTDILVFDGANLTFKGTVALNQRVQIICMDSITIGDDVMISRDVVIRDNDGGHEILTEGYKKTIPVNIGNHVWIGQGALIMKGVTIGDGAIISAGAWVAANVKPNTLVMGDPARSVKKNIQWRQ
jgi:acetyltransferase-like isoleucine patch superfamily enzyme/coenzyme F420-reducing hydrogenase beta subunit